MQHPNPNIPPGMALEKASRSRSKMRVAVVLIVLLHVALFSGILFNACSQKSDEAKNALPQKINVAENNQPPALPPPDAGGGAVVPLAGGAGGGIATGGSLPLPLPGAGSAATTLPPAGAATGGATGGLTSLPTPGANTPSGTPAASGSTSTPPVATAAEHTIQSGDNFYVLAKKYGVGFKQIQDANPNVAPTKLQIGQKVQIPAALPKPASTGTGGTGSAASSGASAASDGYVVKNGDNLSLIAKRFGTTVKALRQANNLQSERLMPEQKLKLPAGAKFSTPSGTPATPSASGPATPGAE